MSRLRAGWCAPLALLATLACEQEPATAPEIQGEVDRQVVAALHDLGYTGPVILSEWMARDDGPTRRGTGLLLPPAALERIRWGAETAPEAAARLQALLSVAEATDPEQLDPAHNSRTAELSGYVSPSRLNGRQPFTSRITFTNRFLSYDYTNDAWYIVQEAEILSATPVARDSSGGHWHSSPASGGDRSILSLPARVGRMVPASGSMSGGAWETVWEAPEHAQEVHFEYELREIGGPNDGDQNVFFSIKNSATRQLGLTRLLANDAHYSRTGGKPPHPEDFNDWGEGDLVARIQAFTAHYHRDTGDRAWINDMGLLFGGRFDIPSGGYWGGAHGEHRGSEADIYPMNMAHAERFQQLVEAHFPSHIPEKSPIDWHVRDAFSPYNR